jgi:Zn finger protein HypA/HybF involved in hydrogenase expression
MALTLLCPSCGRRVYLEEGDTPVCPVCSSPLIETVEPAETEVRPPEDGPN